MASSFYGPNADAYKYGEELRRVINEMLDTGTCRTPVPWGDPKFQAIVMRGVKQSRARRQKREGNAGRHPHHRQGVHGRGEVSDTVWYSARYGNRVPFGEICDTCGFQREYHGSEGEGIAHCPTSSKASPHIRKMIEGREPYKRDTTNVGNGVKVSAENMITKTIKVTCCLSCPMADWSSMPHWLKCRALCGRLIPHCIDFNSNHISTPAPIPEWCPLQDAATAAKDTG